MRSIKLPDIIDPINELKIALTYKSGIPKYELEAKEEAVIEEIYKKYEKLQGTPDDDFKSLNLKNQTNDAIYEAYDETQEGNRLCDLRSRILLKVNRCPFCGISAADELDHHLPRSIYKAISVYSSNLIPICHKCNNKKRTVTGVNIEERFTHVYYDKFPDFPLLVAEVEFKNDTLSINFKIDPVGIPDLLFKQLSFIIERINLNARLKKECNVYLASMSTSLIDAYGKDSSENLKLLLTNQSNDNKKIFGLNDWRTAFMFSLSNCEEFCNGGFKKYLQGLEPEEN